MPCLLTDFGCRQGEGRLAAGRPCLEGVKSLLWARESLLSLHVCAAQCQRYTRRPIVILPNPPNVFPYRQVMERIWATLWGCWDPSVAGECKCGVEGDPCTPGMCQCLDDLVTGQLHNGYRPLQSAT